MRTHGGQRPSPYIPTWEISFEGVCVNYRHPAPRRGVPRVCSGGPESVSASPPENSWRLDSMRRRGASAAFARNPELQIGFGTLCELILGGLAPKGPKRQPQAVQRLFKNGSKEPKGWIRGAQGTQKAATGSPRAPQREPKGFRELSLYTYIYIYIQTPDQPPQRPLC